MARPIRTLPPFDHDEDWFSKWILSLIDVPRYVMANSRKSHLPQVKVVFERSGTDISVTTQATDGNRDYERSTLISSLDEMSQSIFSHTINPLVVDLAKALGIATSKRRWTFTYDYEGHTANEKSNSWTEIVKWLKVEGNSITFEGQDPTDDDGYVHVLDQYTTCVITASSNGSDGHPVSYYVSEASESVSVATKAAIDGTGSPVDLNPVETQDLVLRFLYTLIMLPYEKNKRLKKAGNFFDPKEASNQYGEDYWTYAGNHKVMPYIPYFAIGPAFTPGMREDNDPEGRYASPDHGIDWVAIAYPNYDKYMAMGSKTRRIDAPFIPPRILRPETYYGARSNSYFPRQKNYIQSNDIFGFDHGLRKDVAKYMTTYGTDFDWNKAKKVFDQVVIMACDILGLPHYTEWADGLKQELHPDQGLAWMLHESIVGPKGVPYNDEDGSLLYKVDRYNAIILSFATGTDMHVDEPMHDDFYSGFWFVVSMADGFTTADSIGLTGEHRHKGYSDRGSSGRVYSDWDIWHHTNTRMNWHTQAGWYDLFGTARQQTLTWTDEFGRLPLPSIPEERRKTEDWVRWGVDERKQ